MKHSRIILLIACLSGLMSIVSCDKNGDFVIFSIRNDQSLGQQMKLQISEDSQTYPVLDRAQHPEPYAYLDDMMNKILASDNITYKDEFDWELSIIKDDKVLNAFATPGGKMYVYTGLIYFLDKEDDLAGVIGHEIAHADQRHGSKALQRQYGISLLLNILTGGSKGTLKEMVANIAGKGAILKFGRDAEAEADDFSVEYLSDAGYACNGAATFFQKLIDKGQSGQVPEFLSTHPSPENRVADINSKATEINCNTSVDDDSKSRYQKFRNSLP